MHMHMHMHMRMCAAEESTTSAALERVLMNMEGASIGDEWSDIIGRDALDLLNAASLDDGEQLSLTLCDDEHIHALNREWRSVDKPTDVLSFPMDDEQLLGDLVISMDTAALQAEQRGHTLRDEVRVLLVHGLLHLLGYDHETSREEYEDMRGAESKLLKRLGWAGQGLIAYSELEGEPAEGDEG